MEAKISPAKYYTPEISEFHFGFEFELTDYPLDEKREWQKVVFPNIIRDFNTLEIALKQGLLRVKYLDHDDIVKCGWEEWEGSEPTRIADKPLIGRQYGFGDFIFCHWPQDGCCHILDATTISYFVGELRNKSELEKVMKMCGITLNEMKSA